MLVFGDAFWMISLVFRTIQAPPFTWFLLNSLKASVIQALVQKDKSISRKPQRFDSVGSSSAEKEQAVFVDFIAVLQRDDLRQPINSAAKISVAAGDVVVFDIR